MTREPPHRLPSRKTPKLNLHVVSAGREPLAIGAKGKRVHARRLPRESPVRSTQRRNAGNLPRRILRRNPTGKAQNDQSDKRTDKYNFLPKEGSRPDLAKKSRFLGHVASDGGFQWHFASCAKPGLAICSNGHRDGQERSEVPAKCGSRPLFHAGKNHAAAAASCKYRSERQHGDKQRQIDGQSSRLVAGVGNGGRQDSHATDLR